MYFKGFKKVGAKEPSSYERSFENSPPEKKGDREGRPIVLITYGCPDEQ